MSGGEGTDRPDGTYPMATETGFWFFYRGVEGHWCHPYGRNWKDIANYVHPDLAELVGW